VEITSDIILKGDIWVEARKKMKEIFFKRTNFSIFLMATSIGILYDEQIGNEDFEGEDDIQIPRNVLIRNTNILDYLFQAAIVTSKTVDFSEEKRMELAFNDEAPEEFRKINYLVKFANFGITKLSVLVSNDPLLTMKNLNDFLASTMEESNFDLYELPEKDLHDAIDDSEFELNI